MSFFFYFQSHTFGFKFLIMDLNQIYHKLLADPMNKMYFTNNIVCGLEAALKHKAIKKIKPLCKELKRLLKEANKLETPTNYQSINYLHIQEGIYIGQKAKSLIEETLLNKDMKIIEL